MVCHTGHKNNAQLKHTNITAIIIFVRTVTVKNMADTGSGTASVHASLTSILLQVDSSSQGIYLQRLAQRLSAWIEIKIISFRITHLDAYTELPSPNQP
ncbi:hypothetical protein PROFUN_07272 [Planoprotostelium fungivorum]|uniref:Uncharacterized protein n=1 Tax=Planoprotostelium fungivorum TaxID=1890364 RepID=A0A2P6NMF7_9EUKA|nr:hypothetical protein PROFUN_07272 [Planoprotostelium fungivorum]